MGSLRKKHVWPVCLEKVHLINLETLVWMTGMGDLVGEGAVEHSCIVPVEVHWHEIGPDLEAVVDKILCPQVGGLVYLVKSLGGGVGDAHQVKVVGADIVVAQEEHCMLNMDRSLVVAVEVALVGGRCLRHMDQLSEPEDVFGKRSYCIYRYSRAGDQVVEQQEDSR